jgi:DNA-binding transcriptional MerR regulator
MNEPWPFTMSEPTHDPARDTSQGTTPETLATIGEMVADFDVTPRTLRFYEQKELIAPLRDGQKRLYSRRDRARLKLILRGKRFGFSLEEIRQLLNLYHIGDQQVTQLARTCDIGRQRLVAMEAQRAELDTAIADLKTQLSLVESQLAERSLGKAAE